MQIWTVADKTTDSFAILGMAGGVLATLIIGEFRRRLLRCEADGPKVFQRCTHRMCCGGKSYAPTRDSR